MLQGTYIGPFSLPWASQSVLWETQCWARCNFASTHLVFQTVARLEARLRQEDTEHTCGILAISDISHPSGNWPEGQMAPNTGSGKAELSLCHCPFWVLPGVNPKGIPPAELPPWEKLVNAFPRVGKREFSALSWVACLATVEQSPLPQIQPQRIPCFTSSFSNSCSRAHMPGWVKGEYRAKRQVKPVPKT